MPIPDAIRIPRSLAREDAYDRLKQLITDGTLEPGEVLRDQQIAQVLGVSRTPVREALRRLEDEGFVETALNRWTRVAPLDLRKTMETYSIIEALEVCALETARLTPDDLKQMTTANDAMRGALRKHQAAAVLEADEAFHAIVLARAANAELYVLV